MRAVIQSRYGEPSSLRLEEVERPTPKDDEVLVRVRAASLNLADVEILRGMILIRMAAPFRPRHRIPGSDIAGEVEAIGKDVASFAPGDEVFGDLFDSGFGALAGYASAPEQVVARKPDWLSFEAAATLPQAAIIALQGLRDIRAVRAGDHVLVNGAGGGMGTFAVQIAKARGAEVTGVDGGAKLDQLRELGADHVIDYRALDYTRGDRAYDLVLDLVGNHPLSRVKDVVRENGGFGLVGGPVRRIFDAMLRSVRGPDAEGRKMALVMWKPFRKSDIDELLELLETGTVRPMIGARYPLEQAPEAMRALADGGVVGKAVITM